MTLLRMDNVGVVVDDLEAAKAFFSELGMELEGETPVEGRLVDAAVGAACLILDRLLSPRPSTLLIGHGAVVGGDATDPAAARSEGISTA